MRLPGLRRPRPRGGLLQPWSRRRLQRRRRRRRRRTTGVLGRLIWSPCRRWMTARRCRSASSSPSRPRRRRRSRPRRRRRRRGSRRLSLASRLLLLCGSTPPSRHRSPPRGRSRLPSRLPARRSRPGCGPHPSTWSAPAPRWPSTTWLCPRRRWLPTRRPAGTSVRCSGAACGPSSRWCACGSPSSARGRRARPPYAPRRTA
mmetsp:Transcript_6019/g.21088  ORF Transcript_6019/g.21088 Transcript_6019/m.21088 type:complete len:202 (+) Transcript_6019:403-1008(+)